MGLIRKYQFYKHLLQVSLFFNAFFVLLGFVALVRWLETQSFTHSELALVGIGTLIFGVVLPLYVFSLLTKLMQELREKTQALVTEAVAQWVSSFKEFEGQDPLQNPKFWVNMALLMFETVGDHSKHPGLQALAEFAPLLRREIKIAVRKNDQAIQSETGEG